MDFHNIREVNGKGINYRYWQQRQQRGCCGGGGGVVGSGEDDGDDSTKTRMQIMMIMRNTLYQYFLTMWYMFWHS
jgi:hypothetical protein